MVGIPSASAGGIAIGIAVARGVSQTPLALLVVAVLAIAAAILAWAGYHAVSFLAAGLVLLRVALAGPSMLFMLVPALALGVGVVIAWREARERPAIDWSQFG